MSEATIPPTPSATDSATDPATAEPPSAEGAATEPPGTGRAAAVEAAQAALAGEHASVYGYGVVGAQLDEEDREPVWRALRDHQRQRDALRERLLAMDVEPVAALPAYALPFAVDGSGSARKLARVMERRLAALYADLVATGPEDELRELGADGLVSSASWAARWGADSPAFPGLDGRTP